MKIKLSNYKCIVIGVSAGGMEALDRLFASIPKDFPLPIIIVQHLHKSNIGYFLEYYNQRCALNVKEADEKEPIKPGNIYFAPAGYHLLIEDDETFTLSAAEKVNFSRPSIDILFESAAYVYGSQLIGIILTGANNDGAKGMKLVKKYGGLTIVQDPNEAEYPVMPQAAIDEVKMDYVLPIKAIIELLINL